MLETIDQCSRGDPFQALRDPNTDHYKSYKSGHLHIQLWHRLCMVYVDLFQYGKIHCFCLFVHWIFFTKWPKIWKWECMSQSDDVLIWYWLKARRPAHSSYKLGADMCRTYDSVVPSSVTQHMDVVICLVIKKQTVEKMFWSP